MNDMTIAEIASGNADFSILVQALDTAGLVPVVADGDADLTVFAPTDAAFIDLAQRFGFTGDTADEDAVFAQIADSLALLDPDGDPIPLLTDILTYHVSQGSQTLAAVQGADSLDTVLGTLVIGTDDGLIDADPDGPNPSFVDGLTDIGASNGVIHAIDRVLLPLDTAVEDEPSGTIADIVVDASGAPGFDDDTGDFDVLLAALDTADLTGVVTNPTAGLTVFAPTDAAFIALAESFGATPADEGEAFGAIVDTLTSLDPNGDPLPLLTEVLSYHVLQGAEGRVALADGSPVASLASVDPTPNGATIVDEEPNVADARFIDAASDLVATNGVAHAIDRVLLPLDIAEVNASGGSGDDDFDVGESVKRIEGGDGTDSATFAASLNDTAISPVDEGFQVETGTQSVTVFDVESLIFDDASLTLDRSAGAAQVARLYEAAFDRDFDLAGLSFWTGVAEDTGLDFIADAFIESDEFETIYGPDPTHRAYIDGLYQNVLDRAADQPGLDFWSDTLDRADFDTSDLLVAFSESEENRVNTENLTDDGVFLIA